MRSIGVRYHGIYTRIENLPLLSNLVTPHALFTVSYLRALCHSITFECIPSLSILSSANLSSSDNIISQALFTVSYLRAHCEMEYLLEKIEKKEGSDSEEGMVLPTSYPLNLSKSQYIHTYILTSYPLNTSHNVVSPHQSSGINTLLLLNTIYSQLILIIIPFFFPSLVVLCSSRMLVAESDDGDCDSDEDSDARTGSSDEESKQGGRHERGHHGGRHHDVGKHLEGAPLYPHTQAVSELHGAAVGVDVGGGGGSSGGEGEHDKHTLAHGEGEDEEHHLMMPEHTTAGHNHPQSQSHPYPRLKHPFIKHRLGEVRDYRIKRYAKKKVTQKVSLIDWLMIGELID